MPDRLASRTLDEPHPSRLGPEEPGRDEILAAHRRAIAAGDDGYLDPVTGLFVFTAAYLAELRHAEMRWEKTEKTGAVGDMA